MEETTIRQYEGLFAISDTPYYSNKSQEQGENELMRIALCEDKEGSWQYSSKHKKWFFLGCESFEEYDSQGHLIKMNVHSPTSLTEDELGSSGVLYHTHPTILSEFMFSYLLEEHDSLNKLIDDPNSEYHSQIINLKNNILAYLAFPSESDLQCLKEHKPSMMRGVVSPYAVVKVIPKDINSLRTKQYQNFIEKSTIKNMIEYGYRNPLDFFEGIPPEIKINSHNSLEELIHETADKVNKQFKDHLLFNVRTQAEQ